MTYIITEPCMSEKDASCVDVCPVDCIYEGEDQYYIHPEECIDCNACVPVCPVDCIAYDDTNVLSGEALEQALAKAREWARKRNQDELLRELAPRAKFRPSVMPEKARRGSRKD